MFSESSLVRNIFSKMSEISVIYTVQILPRTDKACIIKSVLCTLWSYVSSESYVGFRIQWKLWFSTGTLRKPLQLWWTTFAAGLIALPGPNLESVEREKGNIRGKECVQIFVRLNMNMIGPPTEEEAAPQKVQFYIFTWNQICLNSFAGCLVVKWYLKFSRWWNSAGLTRTRATQWECPFSSMGNQLPPPRSPSRPLPRSKVLKSKLKLLESVQRKLTPCVGWNKYFYLAWLVPRIYSYKETALWCWEWPRASKGCIGRT